MISEDELEGQLREQGVEDAASVKLARAEGDGSAQSDGSSRTSYNRGLTRK